MDRQESDESPSFVRSSGQGLFTSPFFIVDDRRTALREKELDLPVVLSSKWFPSHCNEGIKHLYLCPQGWQAEDAEGCIGHFLRCHGRRIVMLTLAGTDKHKEPVSPISRVFVHSVCRQVRSSLMVLNIRDSFFIENSGFQTVLSLFEADLAPSEVRINFRRVRKIQLWQALLWTIKYKNSSIDRLFCALLPEDRSQFMHVFRTVQHAFGPSVFVQLLDGWTWKGHFPFHHRAVSLDVIQPQLDNPKQYYEPDAMVLWQQAVGPEVCHISDYYFGGTTTSRVCHVPFTHCNGRFPDYRDGTKRLCWFHDGMVRSSDFFITSTLDHHPGPFYTDICRTVQTFKMIDAIVIPAQVNRILIMPSVLPSLVHYEVDISLDRSRWNDPVIWDADRAHDLFESISMSRSLQTFLLRAKFLGFNIRDLGLLLKRRQHPLQSIGIDIGELTGCDEMDLSSEPFQDMMSTLYISQALQYFNFTSISYDPNGHADFMIALIRLRCITPRTGTPTCDRIDPAMDPVQSPSTNLIFPTDQTGVCYKSSDSLIQIEKISFPYWTSLRSFLSTSLDHISIDAQRLTLIYICVRHLQYKPWYTKSKKKHLQQTFITQFYHSPKCQKIHA